MAPHSSTFAWKIPGMDEPGRLQSMRLCSAFFTVQLSHPYMTTGKTIALTRWTFVGKVMSLLFNMLSRLVITFFPRSKRLDIIFLIYIFLNFLNFIIVCFVQSLSTTL